MSEVYDAIRSVIYKWGAFAADLDDGEALTPAVTARRLYDEALTALRAMEDQ